MNKAPTNIDEYETAYFYGYSYRIPKKSLNISDEDDEYSPNIYLALKDQNALLVAGKKVTVAEFLFNKMYPSEFATELTGFVENSYDDLRSTKGYLMANLWYYYQIPSIGLPLIDRIVRTLRLRVKQWVSTT